MHKNVYYSKTEINSSKTKIHKKKYNLITQETLFVKLLLFSIINDTEEKSPMHQKKTYHSVT